MLGLDTLGPFSYVIHSKELRDRRLPLMAARTFVLIFLSLTLLSLPAAGQNVTLTPTSLAFGVQALGTTSVVRKITLTNTGNAALTISSIAASGSYSQTSTCGASVAAGGKCVISVVFTPTALGTTNGSLTITDNASDSPQIASLKGTGVQPVVLSPTTTKFASRTVGTTSSPVAFTLTNNLSTTVTIDAIGATGDFAQTNNCGGSLATKATCTISVTFTPTVTGTRTGALTVSDSASNSPQTATLSGTGNTSGLVSVAVSPTNPVLTVGGTQQFMATGTFNTGSSYDLTQSVTWSAGNASVATITNTAGGKGLATALALGTSSIKATVSAITGSATLVVKPPLVAIAVTPKTAAIALGQTKQFTATGTYSDGSKLILNNTATWSSSDTTIGTITTGGLATGVGQGTVTVSAAMGTISGSASLTVSPAALVSLSVTPANPSVRVGSAQQFVATGHFSDATTQDLTTSVTWSSSSSTIATISNANGTKGLATGVANGSTNISATEGQVSGSTNLTVGDATCSGPCVLTYRDNLTRDGVVANETALNPSNVNSSSFGRIGTVTGLNGQIYTQPLYMSGLQSASSQGNVVFVATETNYVYAIDADTYQQVWGRSYIPAGESPLATGNGLDLACTNITPNVGITGTPVIDPNIKFNANPVMYFVTKSVDGDHSYHQRLHAVDVVTGAEVFGGPVEVTTPAGSPMTFDPLNENQRSALALTYDSNMNPQVYIAWGSHCDAGGFRGWMMKYNVSAGVLSTAPTAYFLPTQGSGTSGGIWMGGGAPAVDDPINGRLYVVTGNGSYDGIRSYGQSIIKLNADLTVADWYTPNNWMCINGIVGNPNCPGDKDLGSGGVILFNVPNGVPEVATAGKQGEIYVMYQSNLGHLDPLPPPADYSGQTCTTGPPFPTGSQNNIAQCFQGLQVLQTTGASGNRSTTAFWNNTLYTGGSGDTIRAFPLSMAIGTFDTTGAAASDPAYYSYPGSSLALSWNGNDPTTGILWSLQTAGYNKTPLWSTVLRAYNPLPDGASLDLLYQSAVGPGAVKFQVPTIANGKVFVAGQGLSGSGTEGQLYVFGLCPCN